MKISEIFLTIQGEGKLAGVPSVFIRTTGCNLRCVWCDSPFTSWEPAGTSMSVDEVMEHVTALGATHVVLTGGEPLLAKDVEVLTRRLCEAGMHLTIETAATVWKPVVWSLASISPKLGNSTPWHREGGRFAAGHELARINLPVIRRFMSTGDYQLKFVIDRPGDLEEVDLLLARISDYDPSSVLLMPQGVTRDELRTRETWLADACLRRGFRFCPRLHILLYGNVRGR